MPVCKYSHIRTCLCSVCHLISLCFMTTSMFPRKYLTLYHVHTQIHTLKDMSSHTFCFMEMCPSTVWHLVFHYFDWCEGTINAMFTLWTLLGCAYVQPLTYEDVSACITLTLSPRLLINVLLKTRSHKRAHVFLTKTYLYPFLSYETHVCITYFPITFTGENNFWHTNSVFADFILTDMSARKFFD